MTPGRWRLLSQRPNWAYVLVALVIAASGAGSGAGAEPRNIILLIGDGMGPEHVKLGRIFANGDSAPLGFETLPRHATMTHNNALGRVTDSAASATAMATGVKVENDVVSVRIPGDGTPLPTIVERAASQGKQTGLVIHAARVTDATPASFAAHATDRRNSADIAHDYLVETRPNVLFGQLDAALTDLTAISAGYQVAHNGAEMAALAFGPGADHVLGHWSTGEPTLADMTTKALDLLEDDADGFFLLVHDQDPDSGGHAHNAGAVKNGVLSVESAFEVAFAWAQSHPETLLIVTADHETGGLSVTENFGAGVLPAVSWSTNGHTATPVDVYAWGVNSELVQGLLDNTDLFRIMTVPEPNGALLIVLGLASLAIVRPFRRR